MPRRRPGDPPTGENARQLVESLFFNFRRYDLGRVGRYKFDKKLDGVASRMGPELEREQRTITKEDIAAIVGHLIECNRGLHPKDDIDHLGNRRIRANGDARSRTHFASVCCGWSVSCASA